jgi:polysaccharide export outer membrane protein
MDMVQLVRIIFLAVLLAPVAGLGADASSYELGAGDVITIRVFGEEDLSFEAIRLSDAGTVPYPFLGEVRAKGRTASDLEAAIARGLRNGYLVDPKVTVTVVEYRDIYVNGEVNEPGAYPFKPGITVRKAIALAGGKTDLASKKNMKVVREGDASSVGRPVSLETRMQPGDILTIEAGFF